MKNRNALVAGMVGIMLSMAAMHAESKEKVCTNASLKGSYAFYQTGEVIGQGPAADIGVFTADGKGNFTGSETVNSPNGIFQITFRNGTYSVNQDCTGTLTWEAVIGDTSIGQRTASIVISKNTKEIQVLSTNLGTVLVGTAR